MGKRMTMRTASSIHAKVLAIPFGVHACTLCFVCPLSRSCLVYVYNNMLVPFASLMTADINPLQP